MQKLLLFFVILSLGGALYRAGQRWQVEQANRTVEIVADWDQVQEISAHYGLSPVELLTLLKKEGVQGIAVTEETIGSLRENGLITIATAPPTRHPLAPRGTLISSGDPSLIKRLQAHLFHRYHLNPQIFFSQSKANLLVPCTYETFRNLPVGFSEGDLALIRSTGLEVVGRVFNTPGLNPSSIRWLLSTLKQEDIRVLIPAGDTVLGFRDWVEETATLLNRYQIVYGSIEFGKQQGDETLSRKLRGKLIRVHSVIPAEASKLAPAEIIDRYTRSASERNIRILYLRLLPFATHAGLQDQVNYLRALKEGLTREGLTLGKAVPFRSLSFSSLLLLLMGLGVSSAVILLIRMVLSVSLPIQVALLAVFFLFPSLFLLLAPHLLAKGWALLSALTFPTLALLQPYRYFRVLGEEPQRRRRLPSWQQILLAFSAVSGITLMGALLIVGLLADRDFLVKANTFVGIKLAHLLPLLGLSGILLGDLIADQEDLSQQVRRAVTRWRRILGQPLSVGTFLGLLIILGVLLFLVARTGNEPGVGVSSLELRLRSLLDRVLLVRPRTKEFLIGHPVLVSALFLAPLLPWGYRIGLLLIGAIGQVSLINTYCHIHTPLQVSLLRSFHGMWIGYILGLVMASTASKFLLSCKPGVGEHNRKEQELIS